MMTPGRTMLAGVMLVFGLGTLCLQGSTSPAQGDDRHGSSCRNSTLKGTYVFSENGFESRAPSTTQPAGDRRPFSYAGHEKYDGRGSFSGINTLATARRPDQTPPVEVSPFVTYTGTYTVNPDCTVEWTSTDEDGFTSVYNLFLSPDGERFAFIGVSTTVLVNDIPTVVNEAVGSGIAYRSDSK